MNGPPLESLYVCRTRFRAELVRHRRSPVHTWSGIDKLRIAVVRTNSDALVFWRKVGFAETGEIKPKYGPFIDDIVTLEKPI